MRLFKEKITGNYIDCLDKVNKNCLKEFVQCESCIKEDEEITILIFFLFISIIKNFLILEDLGILF